MITHTPLDKIGTCLGVGVQRAAVAGNMEGALERFSFNSPLTHMLFFTIILPSTSDSGRYSILWDD